MRSLMVVAVSTLIAGAAWAQTPPAAPPAGSGSGGSVGPSVMTPSSPTGKTPPGTPTDSTVPGQVSRNTTGQDVIGQTANPPTAVPGNTGGQGTGAK